MPTFKQEPAPEGDYTIVPNSLLRNPNISLQAKGLYAYMRSHSDGWSMSTKRIAEAVGVHLDTLPKYFGELEDSGYLKRERSRSSNGTFSGRVFVIYGETVHGETPYTGKHRIRENTVYGKTRQHKKTNSYKKTKEEEKTKDITPYSPPGGDSRPEAATKTRNRYPDEFEEWWRTYPRRKNASKKAAHTQWAKAVKEVDAQRLLELTASYARNPGVSDERYIPHPQKWLKDQRWESIDETNTGSVSQPKPSGIEAWLGYDPNAPQSDIVDAEIVDTKELPGWIG